MAAQRKSGKRMAPRKPRTKSAPLRLGPNDLIITATEESGATITTTVHVEFAPVALSRTGCGSAPAADLIAVLMLGLMAPRRRKR